MPPMSGMPPGMPAGIAGAGSGFSMISDSVVRIMAATLAPFSSAVFTTLTGSIIPISNRSPKVFVSASKP